MRKKITEKTLQLKAPTKGRIEIWDILSPLGLRITERSARSWCIMYRIAGKQRRLTLGSYPALGLPEAREAAKKALRSVANGVDPAAERVAVPGVQTFADTFSETAAAYLERHVRKNCRASTYKETARIFSADLSPIWGTRPVASITRHDVESVLDAIAERGAEVQRNRVLARLRTFFGWCVDREILATSPVARIKPTREQARDRVLDDDEIRWLCQACGAAGWPFGAITKLLLLTGQRRDEVTHMQWRELDLERRVWHLPGERVKNGRAHDIALSQPAMEIIADLPKTDDVFVFSTNGRPVSGFSKAKVKIDRLMAATRREQGIEGAIEPWILHDLRRTAASGMAGLGIAPHIVDKVLNHVSGTIRGVAAIYNRHLYEPERAAALEAWSDYVTRLVRPSPTSNVVELRKNPGG